MASSSVGCRATLAPLVLWMWSQGAPRCQGPTFEDSSVEHSARDTGVMVSALWSRGTLGGRGAPTPQPDALVLGLASADLCCVTARYPEAGLASAPLSHRAPCGSLAASSRPLSPLGHRTLTPGSWRRRAGWVPQSQSQHGTGGQDLKAQPPLGKLWLDRPPSATVSQCRRDDGCHRAPPGPPLPSLPSSSFSPLGRPKPGFLVSGCSQDTLPSLCAVGGFPPRS